MGAADIEREGASRQPILANTMQHSAILNAVLNHTVIVMAASQNGSLTCRHLTI